MRIGRTIAVVAGIALLCACVTRPQSPVDAKACRADGGVIQGVGMFATPACVRPYADAGKICSSRSDCQGACHAAQDAVIGEVATGTCQKNTHDHSGCHDGVEDGRVVPGMCWE